MRADGHRRIFFSLLLAVAAAAAPAGAQTVHVSPTAMNVPLGSDRRLTATVDGAANTAVIWAVNGIPGGNASVGTIDATGKYTAPGSAVVGSKVTVRAVSVANPAASASCVVTLINPMPWVTRISPNPVLLGPFTLQVSGGNFVTGAQVLWNGKPLPTLFQSATLLTATGVATQTLPAAIAVANPGPSATSLSYALSVVMPAATGTRGGTQTPTRRPESTRTVTSTATSSPARTATSTRVATETATRLPATVTATGVATSTQRPPSTETPRPSATATASAPPTLTATATQPATETATRLPSTATATIAIATATFSARPPSTETPRPTATATATSVPPTLTATTTPSAMQTATATMLQTATATMMMSATARTEVSRTAMPTTTGSPARTRTATPSALPSVAVHVAPAAASLQPGGSQQFQATVTGTANQAVVWQVNATPGGDSSVGTITGAGLYTAPASAPSMGFVTVSAVSAVNSAAQGSAMVAIQDPLAVTYGRFLDQATFGPTQALTAHLAQIGIPAFIDEQFAMPESPWPALDTAQRSDAVDAFFANALAGQDQLRQRVIFALSEIIVEAMNKNTNGDQIVPWLQLLSRNAFGNYRTLLKEIALDASMGWYLDLANSGLSGGAPNENFPREVMQLFSIGLYQLNLDGSVQVDTHNVPIPTYTQTDVQQLAKALTGWTYGNPSGTPPSYGNFNYYPGPMLPVAAYHNTSAKTILGQPLPANQSIQQDLDGAIDIIFQHPNVGPFVATRLIRALVTSNPSPAYIARVATAFNGTGTRGDMQAVLRAILLDPEARNDAPPANFGRLRTPMQHTIALSRALGLDLGPADQFAYLFYDMNEGLLDAASVFGHYSPSYHIPMTPLFGPEFQIYAASDAIDRANLFYGFMYSPWPINPALQPFVDAAADPATLVNAVDHALLYGRMLPATRTALLTALPAMPDANSSALTALYLTSMSGEYLVEH